MGKCWHPPSCWKRMRNFQTTETYIGICSCSCTMMRRESNRIESSLLETPGGASPRRPTPRNTLLGDTRRGGQRGSPPSHRQATTTTMTIAMATTKAATTILTRALLSSKTTTTRRRTIATVVRLPQQHRSMISYPISGCNTIQNDPTTSSRRLSFFRLRQESTFDDRRHRVELR